MAAVSLSVSTVKPLGDRVFVKVSESEEKTAGGILLPDTAKEKPQRGEIISVGSGKVENGKTIPVDLKTGMKVLFSKFSGTEVKVNNEDMLVLRDEDIIAVVE